MTLPTGLREPRELDTRPVPRMTLCTGTNRTIGIRRPDLMAGDTTRLRRGGSLEGYERVRLPEDGTRVMLLREGDLLLGEGLTPENRGECGCGVPAPEELIVLGAMALRANCRCERCSDREASMIYILLSLESETSIAGGRHFPRLT